MNTQLNEAFKQRQRLPDWPVATISPPEAVGQLVDKNIASSCPAAHPRVGDEKAASTTPCGLPAPVLGDRFPPWLKGRRFAGRFPESISFAGPV
jgi:hypothetical protein